MEVGALSSSLYWSQRELKSEERIANKLLDSIDGEKSYKDSSSVIAISQQPLEPSSKNDGKLSVVA